MINCRQFIIDEFCSNRSRAVWCSHTARVAIEQNESMSNNKKGTKEH